MTALLIDEFKGEQFVFSDGITMTGDLMRIVSRKSEKSSYHHDKTVISVACGSAALSQECRALIDQDIPLTPDNIKTKGDGQVLIVEQGRLETVNIWHDDDKDAINTSRVTYILKNEPHFSGSGGDFMAGAYYALEPRKAKSRDAYIKLIKKVFKAATQYTGTMTEVTHIKTIKAGK